MPPNRVQWELPDWGSLSEGDFSHKLKCGVSLGSVYTCPQNDGFVQDDSFEGS